MTDSKKIATGNFLPILLEKKKLNLLIVGGHASAVQQLKSFPKLSSLSSVTIVAPVICRELKELSDRNNNFEYKEKGFAVEDLDHKNLVIAAAEDGVLNEIVREEAASRKIFVHSVTGNGSNDFTIMNGSYTSNGKKTTGPSRPYLSKTDDSETYWKKIATYLVAAFALMVIGYLVISSLPLPTTGEMIKELKPYFNYQFLFFVIAGFAAQMVDGALSMGYGVISATCLMSFGIPPVSSSAAIHTSEIFTTGISGYSHYKFGNVNKKLFKHLVIPGVLGAIGGALLLVLLGEKAGKWLMPIIALYAMFLGLKIILKAVQMKKANSKAKRIGWLAGAGGFLDSFGGGGWGPIVTSTLVAKGRDPKYTVGSVCLTEFFVTLASAITFFLTVGVHHWNIVLGLIIGGGLAAPIAARLAGKLPKKTMMIAVGLMVMIWCVRMLIKSIALL